MSQPLARFRKDPDAVLDYTIDWSRWLAGDTIIASTWVVPSGMTKNSDTYNSTQATVWVAGGTLGNSYSVVNRITTAGGRTDDRTIKLIVEDR